MMMPSTSSSLIGRSEADRGDSTGTNGKVKCAKRVQAKVRTKVDKLFHLQ
jgi:hypothetical protein